MVVAVVCVSKTVSAPVVRGATWAMSSASSSGRRRGSWEGSQYRAPSTKPTSPVLAPQKVRARWRRTISEGSVRGPPVSGSVPPAMRCSRAALERWRLSTARESRARCCRTDTRTPETVSAAPATRTIATMILVRMLTDTPGWADWALMASL